MFIVYAWAAGAAPPNILLISADTLRADRLGCYGYPHRTSQSIDALAREALVFDNCVCEVPLTTPSFGAMLSSRYPRLTGVTRNGMRMPEDVPFLTEAFKKAGYHTACVQSNWPLKQHICAFGRGFDVYEDKFREKRWGFMLPERDANTVTDIALKLYRERPPQKPYFFWVHYSDPHAPYRFHKGFNPSGQKVRLLNAVDRVRAKYDSEVAYMDYHIGRLLAEVTRDNTFILFMSDHGESLYEHGYLGHGRRIYQDNLHVPLLLYGSGITAGRTDAPACIIDVAPTLLACAGVPRPEGMLGVNLLDKPAEQNRIRFLETYGGAVPRIPGATVFMAERHPMRQGLIDQKWKFIVGGQRSELYDLVSDPAEETNLANAEPARVKDYLSHIAEWNKRIPKKKAQRADMSKEDIEALESLGYLH